MAGQSDPLELDDALVTAMELSGDQRKRFIEGLQPELAKEVVELLDVADQVDDDFLKGVEHNEGFPAIEGVQLLQLVGQGGMGQVYLGREESALGRYVAVKIVRHTLEGQRLRERFRMEQEAAALMDHPNIARILDAGVTRGSSPYYVMEYVDGMPITQYCSQHEVSLRKRLELFDQLCAAMQHAHQKGIIHRDLKPSNILVAEIDGEPRVKVIDFGIAKTIDSELGEQSVELTQAGELLGTLRYMSPEQTSLESTDIDTRSDVYSLGVVLYELLTGDTPIGKQRLKELAMDAAFHAIQNEEAPAPSDCLRSMAIKDPTSVSEQLGDTKTVISQLAGELDWIALKAIEKDRRRRYQGASQLQDDVRRFLENRVVLARPPSLRYRVAKFTRRNLRLVIASACFVLVLVGAGIGLAFSTAWALDEAERAGLAENIAIEKQEQLSVANKQLSEVNKKLKAEREQVAATNKKLAETNEQLDEKNGQLEQALSVGYGMLESKYARPKNALLTATLMGFDESSPTASEARMKVFLAMKPLSQVLQVRGEAFTRGNLLQIDELLEGYKRAAKLLDEAIRQEQNLGFAYLARAELHTLVSRYLKQNAPVMAFMARSDSVIEADWNRAVELLPESSLAYSGRAYFRNDILKDPAGAWYDVWRAVELNPRNEQAQRLLAKMFAVKEDWGACVRHFKFAFHAAESNTEVIFKRTGQTESANNIVALSITYLLGEMDILEHRLSLLADASFYAHWADHERAKYERNRIWEEFERGLSSNLQKTKAWLDDYEVMAAPRTIAFTNTLDFLQAVLSQGEPSNRMVAIQILQRLATNPWSGDVSQGTLADLVDKMDARLHPVDRRLADQALKNMIWQTYYEVESE